MRKRLASFGIDGFITSLLLFVLVAYLKPTWGSDDSSPFPLKSISNIGVSFIFFFYGLGLSMEELKEGLRNIPLHILVQGSSFVLFPLIIWTLHSFISPDPDNTIWTGIFFLAALPSTVSSSVVMVSIAKGNLPAAIFNASISSLIGVFMTPIIVEVFINTKTDGGQDLSSAILDLIIQVVIPVGLGLFLHRFFAKWIKTQGKRIKIFDQAIIILIVYRSFSESFEKDLFALLDYSSLFILSASMLGLFFMFYFGVMRIGKTLNFSMEDRITAAFCGSKKSLVHGTVMSNVLFKGSSSVGIILMPLMIYHTLQLMVGTVLAEKLSKRERLS
ncbi:MAG: bile acid:sodium symporter [Chitinophagales bacterium]|nr:bile acid:sodium symporter [Chitinophagales bacterium]